MPQRTRQAVLLERDDVLLRCTTANGSGSWDDYRFLPFTLEALRLFAENDIAVIVFSEERGARDDRFAKHQLDRLNRRMLLEIALAGGKVEGVYSHSQNIREYPLGQHAFQRLLFRAIAEANLLPAQTWFISDRESDVDAAEYAGCHGILLRRNNFLTGDTRREDFREVASNLYEVAERLIRRNIPRLADLHRRKNDFPIPSVLPVFPNARSPETDLL